MAKDPEEPTMIDDEQILRNLISNLRDRSRLAALELEMQPSPNPDVLALQAAWVEDYLRDARALHRFMIAHGVRGLGAVDY